MPGPHDFTVSNTAARLARRSRPLTSCLALRSHAHTTPSRPPHPALHVRDDRDTPLVDEAGWQEICHRILKNRSVIFFEGGLDGPDQLDPAREFGLLSAEDFGPAKRRTDARNCFGLPVGRIKCVDAGPRLLLLSRPKAHGRLFHTAWTPSGPRLSNGNCCVRRKRRATPEWTPHLF